MSKHTELLAPTLSDELVASAHALIGTPIRIEQYNHEASRDAIRHYAWGLGDDNPLYSDPEYAGRTRWGGIVAPPTFPYAIFDTTVAPGLPDIQWVYSGTDWNFGEPIRRNDEITAAAKYAGVAEVAGKRVARMLVQTGEVVYRNQKGQRDAKAVAHTFRIPRANAEGGCVCNHARRIDTVARNWTPSSTPCSPNTVVARRRFSGTTSWQAGRCPAPSAVRSIRWT